MADLDSGRINGHYVRKALKYLKGMQPRDYDFILPGEMNQFLDGIQLLQTERGPRVRGVLSPRENDKAAESLRLLLGSISSRERTHRSRRLNQMRRTGGIKHFVQQVDASRTQQ